MGSPTTISFLLILFFNLSSSSSSSTTSTTPTLLYQSLHVGSLPDPPPSTSTSTSSPSFLFQTKQQQEREQNPNSLHVLLHHIDSISSNSTPSHLLHLRLRRDASRVSSLLQSSSSASSFNSSVVSGLPHGSGEYFTRIGIGSPPISTYLVLDTGSDVVWLQCSPCRKCYSQSDPVFEPNTSLSFAVVPCFSRLCRFLDVAGCDIRRRSCLYQVSYGDGSVTAGELATETFTFQGGVRVDRVAFGCGHDNEGLFVSAGGLLGLGRGKLSFSAQLGRRFGRLFSYCLVDRTSSVSNQNQSSTLIFGNDETTGNQSKIVYTPMVTNPRLNTFYYVELTAISVGGTKLPGITGSDLKLNPITGRGGVIIDSGTSVTRLARPVYVALRDAFRGGAVGLKAVDGFSLFDTCYDLSGRKVVKVPTVAMHFGGGGELSLPAENYLIPVDRNGVFCFAFAGTDGGISIIGNIQQQGFRVVFDESESRIGFGPKGC